MRLLGCFCIPAVRSLISISPPLAMNCRAPACSRSAGALRLPHASEQVRVCATIVSIWVFGDPLRAHVAERDRGAAVRLVGRRPGIVVELRRAIDFLRHLRRQLCTTSNCAETRSLFFTLRCGTGYLNGSVIMYVTQPNRILSSAPSHFLLIYR